ncbi:hypothetical protein ACRAWF_08930 [Streptomyces sp. L7]
MQRRIKRMEEAGVIVGNVAVVDLGACGQNPITVIVEVHAERTNTAATWLRSRRRCSGPARCSSAGDATGEADFVLILNVATMTEYAGPRAPPVRRRQRQHQVGTARPWCSTA